MNQQTTTRREQTQNAGQNDTVQASGAPGNLLMQVQAFARVAGQAAQQCKKKEEAQQELERRRNGSGQ